MDKKTIPWGKIFFFACIFLAVLVKTCRSEMAKIEHKNQKMQDSIIAPLIKLPDSQPQTSDTIDVTLDGIIRNSQL